MGKKKCPECPPPGAPAYMTTFGDLMSLLLTFFILLLTFSSMQESKFKQALGSLKGHLGVLDSQPALMINEKIYIPMFNVSRSDARQLGKAVQSFLEEIKKMNLSNFVQVAATEKGLAIRLLSPVLFEKGSDKLKPAAYPILDKIVNIAEVGTSSINVDGYTDDTPPLSPEFPTNWHLSAARAISVLRYMVSQGISSERFTASGHGENNPVVPNIDAQSRARNRRVEIFLAYKYLYTPKEISPFASWDEVYLKSLNKRIESGETTLENMESGE